MMIGFLNRKENTWNPPDLNTVIVKNCIHEAVEKGANEYLAIFQISPYIDSLFIRCDKNEPGKFLRKRFAFHEGYTWKYEDECFFHTHCLKNPKLNFSCAATDEIYDYYTEKYPDWKLRKYYTKSVRVLDHIYYCMKRGSAQEILYKASLDELAENIEDMDELNLLSSKPGDLYEGLSMRVLRALNSQSGALLLSKSSYRHYIKTLNIRHPELFEKPLHDMQCLYLKHLIDENLPPDEAGRLFCKRNRDLLQIWSIPQYKMFIHKEAMWKRVWKEAEKLMEIDPIYKQYLKAVDFEKPMNNDTDIRLLIYYLSEHRKKYDRAIRQSNRKRCQDWQERNNGYVVRFPQTINDICREAVYMRNCLLSYVDAVIHNDTTVLFLRNTEDVNKPFITMEVYEGELYQAYHRFNEACTPEEIAWIHRYCDRHSIGYMKTEE